MVQQGLEVLEILAFREKLYVDIERRNCGRTSEKSVKVSEEQASKQVSTQAGKQASRQASKQASKQDCKYVSAAGA